MVSELLRRVPPALRLLAFVLLMVLVGEVKKYRLLICFLSRLWKRNTAKAVNKMRMAKHTEVTATTTKKECVGFTFVALSVEEGSNLWSICINAKVEN